jgi:hypothetical protein
MDLFIQATLWTNLVGWVVLEAWGAHEDCRHMFELWESLA